jgi:hypothetical protein
VVFERVSRSILLLFIAHLLVGKSAPFRNPTRQLENGRIQKYALDYFYNRDASNDLNTKPSTTITSCCRNGETVEGVDLAPVYESRVK